VQTRVLSLLVAMAAAMALVSASGATTTNAQRIARIDVSTRSAVVNYLRSINVNPKGVVIQRSRRNYAGAHCPGKGWSCTSTTHPVVQVARTGGRNTFRCSNASCAVVQVAPAAAAGTNTARCIEIPGLTQSCTINQSSASQNNVAVIYQAAVGVLNPTQRASLTAAITQRATGSSNTNTACVSQSVGLDGSTVSTRPISVALEAHQSVTITQDSSNGGNFAQSSATLLGACDSGHSLTQFQLLNSIVAGRGSVTQNENAASNGPNVSLDIEQNQSSGFKGLATGANSAVFSQTSNLQAVANTPNGPISQTQSSPDTTLPYSGLVGTVNQDSSGISTANATQTETQCEDAAKSGLTRCDTNDPDANEAPTPLTQTQYGPEAIWKTSSRTTSGHHGRRVPLVHKGVGTATQTGNPNDTFTINQSSTQNNDQGPGSQQTNVVQGDCSTSGNCTVSQNTNVDGQTHTNTQSGSDVDTTTNCTGSACESPEIVFDGSPGVNMPPGTLGPYRMTPFVRDPQYVCPADGSIVSGVSDPAGTIGFSTGLSHDTIGDCWATWSNDYTGDVYDTYNVDPDSPATQVTLTLPSGTNAFYLYAEPQSFSPDFEITATAQDGTTSGPISVNGDSGAQYYGFYGLGGATLSSITVTDGDPTGFAIGEFGISPAAVIP
jgi:hypothetical protein